MKSLKKTIIFGLLSIISLLAFAKQEKVLQIFRNGEIIQEYSVDEIDYIEVNDLIPAPDNVNASIIDNQITIKWNPVEGATYNIYRSADNVNFTLLASKLTETTFIDSNPLQGSNFYRIKAVINDVESGYTSSVIVTLTSSRLDSGIYLGITGFNQTLYEYPVIQLTQSSVDGFRDFIDGLTMRNGTLLYFSVDQALNSMQSTVLPDDISTAAIVTFTDGLDQGSMMMDVPYDNDMAYLDALNHRIMNETISSHPITAFSIGIRGKDVADIDMFRANLAKLASSPDNATEVSSMSEVNEKFKEIAQKLSESNYVQTINLKMPGLSNGTRVRFTFDNVNVATNSQVYVEGTFNLKERSLEGVEYVGLTSTSGTTIKGTVDGIFVNFTFDGVHTDNNVLIKSEYTDEWTYIASNDTWQINSEFDKTENSDIVTNHSTAVIMLVLDCSSSLSDDFVKVKANAKDFMDIVLENAQNPYEVSGVTLNYSNKTIQVGNTIKLVASVIPSTALLKDVTWVSSNPEVATVNQEGLVKGIAPGTATITVTTKDGGFSATCELTIIIPVNSITINPDKLELNVGESYKLNATINPDNASIKDLAWWSSDPTIASIDETGTVIAKSFGSTKIVAVTTDGTDIAETSIIYVSQPGVGGYINNIEYVDLGLPSGLKWASESLNSKFAWGEITTKDSFTESNSVNNLQNVSDFSGIYSMDAARFICGSSWRVPKKTEFEELISECIWEYIWTGQGYGFGAFKVTGPNGRHIIIPVGSKGSEFASFWSSTPDPSDTRLAYALEIGGNYHTQNVEATYRYFGLLIWPVSD